MAPQIISMEVPNVSLYTNILFVIFVCKTVEGVLVALDMGLGEACFTDAHE